MTDATYDRAAAPAAHDRATASTPDILSDSRLPDGRFAPGHSGNPSGRPRSPRARTQAVLDALLATHAEALIARPLSSHSTAT